MLFLKIVSRSNTGPAICLHSAMEEIGSGLKICYGGDIALRRGHFYMFPYLDWCQTQKRCLNFSMVSISFTQILERMASTCIKCTCAALNNCCGWQLQGKYMGQAVQVTQYTEVREVSCL